jgi:membrane associated rhomboid family serine protease
MAFLWAMGSVLEKRLGHGWLFALYLATGVAANLVDAIMGYWIYSNFPRGIGASGAISGLMGIYAVRCYFKTMIFPFPVMGLFSYLLPLPLHLKVRMNALVVVSILRQLSCPVSRQL